MDFRKLKKMFLELKNPVYFLKKIKHKNRAAEVVVAAESMSSLTGIAAIDIIKKTNKRLKNIYFDEIIRLYSQGEQKSKMYESIFDNVFIKILSITEKKSIEPSGIFQAYIDTRERIIKAKNKIIGAIVEPFVTYFIVALIGFFTMSNVMRNKSVFQSMKVDIGIINFIYIAYWFIIIGIAAVILVFLFTMQRKIPLLREAYKELDTYNYLSVINIMLKNGVPATDISTLLGTAKKGAEGIISFFKKMLKIEELIVLQIGIETYQYEKIIETLLSRRSSKFEARIDAISSSLKQVLFLISMVPIGIVLATIFMLVTKVMKSTTTF